MDTTPDPSNEDATDRLAEVTEAWESSPLTDPEKAIDPEAKRPIDHGDTGDVAAAPE